MKLSAPWIEYYQKIEALFGQDPEIRVVYEEEGKEIKLYVENARKADALAQLLPAEKTFGNVTLKITVLPANVDNQDPLTLIQEAFAGNPALDYVQEAETLFGKMYYAVFANKVVQYFNDDIGDINGLKSTLYQDIAKDVFKPELTLHYCTNTSDNSLRKPLGEWP